MADFYFVSEDPTNTSSIYSKRIPQLEWHSHRATIRTLHDQGLTRRQILAHLSHLGFCPSFGQLVAQMTRWRMIRYDKYSPPVCQSPLRQSRSRFSGILRLAEILLDPKQHRTMSVVVGRIPDGGTNISPELEDNSGLAYLMTTFTLSSARHSMPATPVRDVLAGNYLATANMLFLGGSYEQAFEAYHGLHRHISTATVTVDQEQLNVQALVGCFKSAVTNHQHSTAINNAQAFLDSLATHNSIISVQSESQEPLVLGNYFDQWPNRDFALAKVVFDLLTFYKTCRKWSTLQQAQWARDITVREWMYSRLVRLPTWDIAARFLKSNPISQMAPENVFDTNNIASILSWAEQALAHFGEIYDIQMQQLRPWSATSLTPWIVLLFWRFDFLSKYSPQIRCPQLQVKLSPDTTFFASCEHTICILARVLLQEGPPSGIGSSHQTLVLRLQHAKSTWDQLEISCQFWAAMKEVLAPSLDERCRTLSEN